MNLKEKIKNAFTLYKKSKKKIFYSIIMFICCLISTIVIISAYNFTSYFINIFNKVDYRSYSIGDSYRTREELDNAINKLSQIDHIIDASYGSPPSGHMTFEDGYKEIMYLERRVPKALPKIAYGRKYKDDETNTMVCSIDIINSGNQSNLFIEERINMKKYLNTEVEIEYDEYDYGENGKRITIDKHKEKFTIIGFFRASEEDGYTDLCFVNKQDSNRLYNTQYSKYLENEQKYYDSLKTEGKVTVSFAYPVYIVLDNNKYLDEVKDALKEKGFNANLDREVTLDKEEITKIFSILLASLVISLFIVLIISIIHINIKTKKEKENIKSMLKDGLSIKEIGNIYGFEVMIENGIIFLITMVITIIACIIVTNKITILYMMGFKPKIFAYLISFIFNVLIPGLLISKKIIKTTK